jgi:hypothetical protein
MRSGSSGVMSKRRAPPISSMSRMMVCRPPSASEVITTMLKAPMVMLTTVRSDRSLCARKTRAAILR